MTREPGWYSRPHRSMKNNNEEIKREPGWYWVLIRAEGRPLPMYFNRRDEWDTGAPEIWKTDADLYWIGPRIPEPEVPKP